ncbi:MAG: pilus assembly PilX N-terminal domain-containing protein, partial [Sedimentisphaerales bacterium]|nr:pilus assembly PilX N-terminal domain-containing protein [Sedimentisphaerales bacterium]
MPAVRYKDSRHQRGAVFVLSMIFLALFSALVVAMATSSGVNVQVASNQHRVNAALDAAQSGLECAKYIVETVSLPESGINYVTTAQANQVWTNLCSHLQTQHLDGKTVSAAGRFTDAFGVGD